MELDISYWPGVNHSPSETAKRAVDMARHRDAPVRIHFRLTGRADLVQFTATPSSSPDQLVVDFSLARLSYSLC